MHISKLFSYTIIKVFIKCKILSEETILSTYMLAHTHAHTQALTHTSTLTIQSLFYTT